jgi:hypothetical protein
VNLRIHGAILSRHIAQVDGVAVEQTLYYDSSDSPACLTLIERRHRVHTVVTVRRYNVDAVAAVFAGIASLPQSLVTALQIAAESPNESARYAAEVITKGETDIDHVVDSVPVLFNPYEDVEDVAIQDYTTPPTYITTTPNGMTVNQRHTGEAVGRIPHDSRPASGYVDSHEDDEDDEDHEDSDIEF